MGESAGHSGRAGPRLRRRLAGRLRAHHHRPRSAPLRPDLRALPQSGTHLDAGLRHRLLPGPARRGYPLRAATSTAATASRRSSPSAPCRRAGVLRDVGRVLQMPYGQVDKLCKLVPQNPAAPSRSRARSTTSRGCRPSATTSRWSRAPSTSRRSSKGLHRHASTHAAGIVIGERPLTEFVPLYRDPKSTDAGDPVQHEMGRAGRPGEVRLSRPEDADGPRQGGASSSAARHRARSVDASRSTTPRPTRCWRAARRSACSRWKVRACGARCVDMRPDRFEDMIVAGRALSARARWRTFRPIARASSASEQTDYLHPKLEPILQATYGIITYQEQVQQIARDLAGYSLGEADILRRAMGKKIRKEMASQRDRFHLRRGRARHRRAATPKRSSMPARNSPNTASTNRTRRPMRF